MFILGSLDWYYYRTYRMKAVVMSRLFSRQTNSHVPLRQLQRGTCMVWVGATSGIKSSTIQSAADIWTSLATSLLFISYPVFYVFATGFCIQGSSQSLIRMIALAYSSSSITITFLSSSFLFLVLSATYCLSSFLNFSLRQNLSMASCACARSTDCSHSLSVCPTHLTRYQTPSELQRMYSVWTASFLFFRFRIRRVDRLGRSS